MNDDNLHNNIEEKVFRLIERKRYAQAEILIGNALRNSPNNGNLLYYLAYIHSENERHKEAETTLKELLGFDPDNEEAIFSLSSVYKDLKQYVEAERIIIELLYQNPEASSYYTLYAKIMLETLHVEKADRLAKEAIRLDPDDISAQCISIICEVIGGNKPEYQQRLSELLRNYPEAHTTAAIVLVVLYEQNKHREALRIAQELLRSDPKNELVVEMIKELRVLTHPTMIPLMPVNKYGWHASAVLWVVGIIVCYTSLEYLSDTGAQIVIYGWLAYILYSWIYPPILKKIMN